MADLLVEFARLSPLMLWAAIVALCTIAAAVVSERAAYGLRQALHLRFTQRYGALVQRAIDGYTTARQQLRTCPSRQRLALARLLSERLTADRDPTRIANTRAGARTPRRYRPAARYQRTSA